MNTERRVSHSIARIIAFAVISGAAGLSGYASRIAVASVGIQVTATTTSNGPGNQDPRAAAVAFLNTANAQQLAMRLGLSRATAAQIISNRPYADVNQLHAKKIVGLAEFQRIERRLGLRP